MIEDRDKRSLEALNQKFEYDIHIWGYEGHSHRFEMTKSIAAFKGFS